MTKRKHPVVDVRIEELAYPDRASGVVLSPMPHDPVGEMLEIPVDHSGRKGVAPMRMKGGLPGQVWRCRVKRSHGGVREVLPLQLLSPSPMEHYPTCPQASFCGGCNYQTINVETELLLKSRQLRALYAPLGVSSSISLYRSPITEGYRSKMEYTFGDSTPGGPLTLGLHRPGHFYDILPTPLCNIVPEDFNSLRKAVERFCRERAWSFYHRATKTGYLRHLVLRAALTTGELMVNLVTTSEHEWSAMDTSEFLRLLHNLSLSMPIVSVFHTTNDSVADVVQADTLTLLEGRSYLEERLFDLTFHVGPFSFFQPNVQGAINLYTKALDLAGDLRGKTVYDLYSGTGTLAQIAATRAQRVVGVEIVEEAVEKAREASQRNHLANVRFVAADVLDELNRLADLGDRPDVVLLDPPRQGIHPKAIAHILSAAPERIVYISCNPTTQVHDLSLFTAGGYRIEQVVAFDQFPRTKHVETVALLSKLDVDKHIDVEIELDELDLTSAESKATYAQIKEYVWNKFELKVSTLYIAQIKRKCGIELREHYNKSKKEKQIIPQCTPEKEEAIMDALRHFKMI